MVRDMSGNSRDRASDELLDAALLVTEETQTIRLSATDSRVFAEALLNPREPNARLKKAAQRYLRVAGV